MATPFKAKPSKYNVRKNQVGMDKPLILTEVVQAYQHSNKKRK